jgi:phosphate transport system substrate-binding protein
VLKFFDWSFTNGDKMALELDVPIPDPVVNMIKSAWKSQIKDSSGKPVY